MRHNGANRTVWVLGCVVAVCVAACSGADPDGDSSSAAAVETPAEAETETSAETETEASAAAPDDDVAPAEGSEVSAAALCEYLTGELPDLRAIGSEVGVMANLTVNLYTWYESQGAVPSGTELDEMTQAECPDVGAEALTLAGLESFTAL
ncbi:hypothetical protein [Pengzhenrongella sicca]|uniref:Uncharacterized protein n=1 Tax=Pengzhenrongella sicca TaxID=2819238 RepID=A0A8A4ZFY0_9MICO|nr:hypothetical protein [Pengzhenrongella sicca]QTE30930.1 hypothetical protein J4E96_08400 [Pengzhenrongella sicca]